MCVSICVQYSDVFHGASQQKLTQLELESSKNNLACCSFWKACCRFRKAKLTLMLQNVPPFFKSLAMCGRVANRAEGMIALARLLTHTAQ